MIYILSIILFLIGFCLCSIKDKAFDNCKPNLWKKVLVFLANDKYNGYFVNIIIAILGVTCAILLTNYDTKKHEINQTVRLLDYLNHEISEKEQRINTEILRKIVDPEYESTNETLQYIQQILPITSIETILTVSPYEYTISSICYNALHECRTNINVLLNDMENLEKNDDIKYYLNLISYELEYVNGVVGFEIKYQNREISYDELYTEVNEFYKNVFSEENFYNIPSVKLYN